MKKLVFATGNQNKVIEIKKVLGKDYEFLSLSDIGCSEEIPEDQDTIEGNAIQKAEYIKNNYGHDCFAEDTGLLVEALNGEPGVYSARYGGEEKSAQKNIQKLLNKLKGIKNRKAHFKTVIALIINDELNLFEGKVDGVITEMESGNGGFGYDPVFIPDGYDKTFAEMTLDEKSKISHRSRATALFNKFLSDK